MATTKVQVVIEAESAAAARQIRAFARQVGGDLGGIQAIGTGLASVGAGLTAGVTLPIAAAGAAALKAAAEIESFATKFEVLLGSEPRARAFADELRRFAAETPLAFDAVATASQKLLAFGVEADDVTDRLRVLGDVALGNSETFGRLVTVFGQTRAAGGAMAEELLQFTDAGVPLLQALSDELGISVREVRDLASEGGVTFDLVLATLEQLTGEGGRFNDAMLAASQTLEGRLSTALDNLRSAGADAVQDLVPTVTRILESVSAAAESFVEMDSTVKSSIVFAAGGAALVGPLLAIAGAVVALKVAIGGLPVLIGLIAGAAVVGGGALLGMAADARRTAEEMALVDAELQKVRDGGRAAAEGLEELQAAAQERLEGTREAIAATEQLVDRYERTGHAAIALHRAEKELSELRHVEARQLHDLYLVEVQLAEVEAERAKEAKAAADLAAETEAKLEAAAAAAEAKAEADLAALAAAAERATWEREVARLREQEISAANVLRDIRAEVLDERNRELATLQAIAELEQQIAAAEARGFDAAYLAPLIEMLVRLRARTAEAAAATDEAAAAAERLAAPQAVLAEVSRELLATRERESAEVAALAEAEAALAAAQEQGAVAQVAHLQEVVDKLGEMTGVVADAAPTWQEEMLAFADSLAAVGDSIGQVAALAEGSMRAPQLEIRRLAGEARGLKSEISDLERASAAEIRRRTDEIDASFDREARAAKQVFDARRAEISALAASEDEKRAARVALDGEAETARAALDERRKAEIAAVSEEVKSAHQVQIEAIEEEIEARRRQAQEEYQAVVAFFHVAKAASLAQAVIAGGEAIIKAVASAPFPFNLPAIGFAVWQTGNQLETIRAQQPPAPPEFGEGAIVRRRMLAVVGDEPGSAGGSAPEAIVPLARLPEVMRQLGHRLPGGAAAVEEHHHYHAPVLAEVDLSAAVARGAVRSARRRR